MNRPLLYIKVTSPRETIFQGPAISLSSINSSGRFDILPGHANFITIIDNQPIEIKRTDNKLMVLGFSQAIIYTLANKIAIFAEPKFSQEQNQRI